MRQPLAIPERASARVVTDIEVVLHSSGMSCQANIYNISADGCMIECAELQLFEEDVLSLSIPDILPLDGIVVWQNSHYAGVRFGTPLCIGTVSALGFKEPAPSFDRSLPRDRFGRLLPVLSGRLPF